VLIDYGGQVKLDANGTASQFLQAASAAWRSPKRAGRHRCAPRHNYCAGRPLQRHQSINLSPRSPCLFPFVFWHYLVLPGALFFCHISGVLGGCDALLFAAIADPTQEETPRKNTRVFSPDSGEGRKGEIEMDKRPERRGKMTSGWKSGLRVARGSGGAQAPCRLASV